jgi:hypothetical protein
MKKIIFTFALAIVGSIAFSQIKAGAFLGYGSKTERVALGVNGEFFVAEKISIAPSFNFLYSKTFDFFGTEVKTTLSEINADLHYYLLNSDAVGVYGLAGLNLLLSTAKVGGESDSDTEVGANIGAGANFLNSGKISPFVEIKYETKFEQVLFGGGVRFTIKGK